MVWTEAEVAISQKKTFKNLPQIQPQRVKKLRLKKEQELAKRIASPRTSLRT
ncbi:MAG: hypothetical protein ACXW39_05270 [Nitrospira sp.]